MQLFYLQLTLSSVIPLDEKGERILQNSGQPGLLLFVNSQEASRMTEDVYRRFAEHFDESDVLFTIVRLTDPHFWTKLEQMGSRDRRFPQLYLVRHTG